MGDKCHGMYDQAIVIRQTLIKWKKLFWASVFIMDIVEIHEHFPEFSVTKTTCSKREIHEKIYKQK